MPTVKEIVRNMIFTSTATRPMLWRLMRKERLLRRQDNEHPRRRVAVKPKQEGFMTQKELIETVAINSGTPKARTEAVIKELIITITHELRNGGDVVLQGIGKFTVKATSARKGVNPSTGAKIDIPAKKKVVFKVHKALKDAIQ